MDYKNELPSLLRLNATGNDNWRPGNDFLKLKGLVQVLGLDFNKHCRECHLVKREYIRGDKMIAAYQQHCAMFFEKNYPEQWDWNGDIKYGETFNVVAAGFWPLCLCRNPCIVQEILNPFIKATANLSLAAQNILYLTGPFAILVNGAVILSILFSKELRKNTALLLIGNLAACDLFVGVHSILFVQYNFPRSRVVMYQKILDGFEYDQNTSETELIRTWTYIMGPMLTMAVTLQVLLSVIMTADKFLKICFAMRPQVALTKRKTLVLLLLSWLVSLTFSILPVFNVGRMRYVDTYWTIPLPTDQAIRGKRYFTIRIGTAAAVQVFLMAIQAISLLAYIPIFIVAKKSEGNFGIRNEARIAKKIFPLVFSNLVFFTIPISLAVFDDKINSKLASRQRSLAEIQATTFLFTNMPVLCVNTNSILNPFLYAMRHPKIKAKLRTKLSPIAAGFSGCLSAVRRCLNIQPNAVGVGQSIEMRTAASITGVSQVETNAH